jgi:hypothetical protein
MTPEVSFLLEVLPGALEFIWGMIARWLDGDESPEVVRLIEILPEALRADLELERQRRVLAAQLEEKFHG